jgi:nucleotide-binding universal stress UspA family protein
MFTRILVPIETDEQTPQVIDVIQLLAAHGPLSVTLVRAHPPLPESDAIAATSAELDRLASRLRTSIPSARFLVEVGASETSVVEVAQQTHADLIVLLPSGQQDQNDLTHPSITTKLVSSGTAPLLIWPKRLPARSAHEFLQLPSAVVVLPLDGGAVAERALPYAIDLANAYGRSLLLVSVTPDLTPPMAVVAEEAFVTPELLQVEQEEVRAYLAKICERYAADTVAPIQSLALLGAPSRRILDSADTRPGSVIVMSTDGRGALARATLGSVTTETLRETSTPLLLIPPHAPTPLDRTAPLKRPTVAADDYTSQR